jgi:hypothetical protein
MLNLTFSLGVVVSVRIRILVKEDRALCHASLEKFPIYILFFQDEIQWNQQVTSWYFFCFINY